MDEWIKFTPSKEHIGLRARFRKVISGGGTEEVAGRNGASACMDWR